jgi:hypothetical protein
VPTTAGTIVASRTTVVAPRRAKAGSRPIVTVYVLRGSPAAAGKVVITVGSKKVTRILTAGKAQVRLPRLKAGRVKIVVRYLGDASTTASSVKKTIKVAG